MSGSQSYKGVESHTISKDEMDKFIQGLVDSQSKNGNGGDSYPMSDFIQNLIQGLMDLRANPVVNPMKDPGSADSVVPGVFPNPLPQQIPSPDQQFHGGSDASDIPGAYNPYQQDIPSPLPSVFPTYYPGGKYRS